MKFKAELPKCYSLTWNKINCSENQANQKGLGHHFMILNMAKLTYLSL